MTTPAGWYADPSGAGGQRYFDGVNWTEHRVSRPGRRHPVWLWALAGVLVLVVGGSGIFAVAESLGLPVTSWLTNTPTPGDTVVDGQFGFVVGISGKALLQADPPPRGVYLIVDVTVTNRGLQTRPFVAQNQKLIDWAGHAYEAQSANSRTSTGGTTVSIDPGRSVDVSVRVDVPKGTRVTAIELHESATSAGVTVDL